MLKHFVVFRFEKDFFNEEAYREYVSAFDHIKETYEGVIDAKVRKNCIDRPANMDLMVEMDLKDASILPIYLQDSEHMRMGEKYNPHVTERISFDYEY